jgi:RHH-type rel operon transcriptional repressor/antitoxin RelB
MPALHLRIPEKLDHDLEYYAKEKDRTKSYLVRKAIESYIQDLQDDRDDYYAAIEGLKENKPKISWEEVQRKNGLLD